MTCLIWGLQFWTTLPIGGGVLNHPTAASNWLISDPEGQMRLVAALIR